MPFSIDQCCTRGNSQHNDQLSAKPQLFVYLYTGELYGDKSGHSAFCPQIADAKRADDGREELDRPRIIQTERGYAAPTQPRDTRGNAAISGLGGAEAGIDRVEGRSGSVEAQPSAHLVLVHDRVGVAARDAGFVG